MLGDDASARDISVALLKATGVAMDAGDFDSLAACFELPHEVESFEGRRVIATSEDFEKTFLQTRLLCL